MLPHDQIVKAQIVKHLHLFIKKARDIFCLKSCVDADLILVFLRKTADTVAVFLRLIHPHTDSGYKAVLVRAWNMIRKAELLNSKLDCRLYKLPFRAIRMLAPHRVGMVVCFYKIPHINSSRFYNSLPRLYIFHNASQKKRLLPESLSAGLLLFSSFHCLNVVLGSNPYIV